jgi:hypothetical protein
MAEAMSGRPTISGRARPQEERSDGIERARRTLSIETGTSTFVNEST